VSLDSLGIEWAAARWETICRRPFPGLKSTHHITADDKKTLKSASALLKAFHEAHPLMSFQMAHTFIAVALDEGKSMSEYALKLGLPQSTVSRHLLDLGPRNRKKGPGLELLRPERDPEDFRRWTQHLTPKGRELIRRVIDGA
jgi:DNA-binding MarR family transcriptional regulator